MIKSFVALSDIHYPYEDPQAMALVTKFLKDFQPDELYLNGDIWDMPQISKYAQRRTEVLRTGNIQDHLDHGIRGVHSLVDAAKPRRTRLALGNHEDRWEAYLGSEAKALVSLKCLDFDKVFQLKGIEWKKYGDGYWLNDRLFLYHGEALGANWTDKERQKIGGSSITGHQHKQGVTYHRDRSRTYKNIGQGCLCQLNPPYLRTPPSWTQGFVYGYIIDDDKFRAIETEIVRGENEIWMAPEGVLYRTELGTQEQVATNRVRQRLLKPKSSSRNTVIAATTTTGGKFQPSPAWEPQRVTLPLRASTLGVPGL